MAATMGRERSKTRMARRKPSRAIMASSGTKTPSRATSAAEEALCPSLGSGGPTSTPSLSTRKAAIPSRPSATLAKTTKKPASGAWLIQVLRPYSRKPPETRSARLRMAATSEPAWGSVRA